MTARLPRRRGRRAARQAPAALLVAATLVAVAVTCARRPPQAHAVAIRSFTFQPETLTVAQGDTIVWTNEDVVAHTATVRSSGGWDSGSLASRATWRLVADTPGRHPYYCVFHPNMQGVVDVR